VDSWTISRPSSSAPGTPTPACSSCSHSSIFLYLGSKTDFSESTQWILGAILLAGILAQSGGFFVHFGVGEAGHASLGTRLTRWGALLIATALVFLAVGIARA
jgi:hypothetical protein